MTVETKIVRIGNSRGVRIPTELLRQSGIEGDVTLRLEEGRIVIAPSRQPRSGWEEELRIMAEKGEEKKELDESTNRFDEEEWEWT